MSEFSLESNRSKVTKASVGNLEEVPSFEEYANYGSKHRNRRISASSGVEGPGVLEFAGSDEPEEHAVNPLHNDSSSVIRFYPEWCQCMDCLKHREAYSPNAPCTDQLRNAFLCPPQGPVARIFAFVLVFILGWIFCWVLLMEDNDKEDRSPASPKGPVFALGVFEILGLFAGILMKCFRLPSLLGPLILGIFIRNIEPINLFRNLEGWKECPKPCDPTQHAQHAVELAAASNLWIKPIRQIALTMILTRAGLELSPKQLKKLKGVVPLLAFGPCMVEACFCALFTYIFFNWLGDGDNKPFISLTMCFVSGFALAAVSPAVVVPGMLSIKKKNLGVGQGIPTLLIAASSIDDVLAISAYTICMGMALHVQGSESSWEEYAGGPLSIVVGIFHGLIVGIFLHFIPSRDNKNKAETRLILLLLFNLVAMFAYDRYELLSGSGSLAVLVASFIASFGWRSQPHWKRPMKQIERSLAHLWTLCVPLLFGTIGREIDFRAEGFTGERVGKILGIICLCLIVRCTTAFLITGFAKINYKERLFCALSWIPKATVQAALAPLVVTKIQAKAIDLKDLKPHGEIVITTAVLAILLTAPLGSILIAFFGPRLLRKPTEPEKETLEEEFPNGDGIDPVLETAEELSPRISKSQPVFIKRISGGSLTSLDEFGIRRTNSVDSVTGVKPTTTPSDKGDKVVVVSPAVPIVQPNNQVKSNQGGVAK